MFRHRTLTVKAREIKEKFSISWTLVGKVETGWRVESCRKRFECYLLKSVGLHLSELSFKIRAIDYKEVAYERCDVLVRCFQNGNSSIPVVLIFSKICEVFH